MILYLKKIKRSLLAHTPPYILGAYEFFLKPSLKESWGGEFNGQSFRSQIFSDLLKSFEFQAIIETGTYRGTTTDYMSKVFKKIIYTVEANKQFYCYSRLRFRNKNNIKQFLGDSRDFLDNYLQNNSNDQLLFYLDAHWSEDLPLNKEIEIIFTKWPKSIILIDDFCVPFDQGYLYDSYGSDKTLNESYLEKNSYFNKIRIFYPSLSSSEETGLKRGCCVLALDPKEIEKLESISSLKRNL